MNGREKARELEKVGRRLNTNLKKAVLNTLEAGCGIGRLLSTGPYSRRQLEKGGHPYRIGGTAPDPETVNRQAGTFLRSWGTTPVTDTGDGYGGSVINSDPVAVYLISGTGHMVARPIDKAIDRRLQKVAAKNIQDAIDRSV